MQPSEQVGRQGREMGREREGEGGRAEETEMTVPEWAVAAELYDRDKRKESLVIRGNFLSLTSHATSTETSWGRR